MTRTPPRPDRAIRRTATGIQTTIGIPPRAASAQHILLRAGDKARSTLPEWTPALYRTLLGWATEQHHGHTFLMLDHTMVAVVVPLGLASRVADKLERDDACGPVLSMARDEPCWVFLADPNGLVVSSEELPVSVVVLGCPGRIPIPVAGTSSDQVRWCQSPNPGRRWLPTLSAVLCAVGWRGCDRQVCGQEG